MIFSDLLSRQDSSVQNLLFLYLKLMCVIQLQIQKSTKI